MTHLFSSIWFFIISYLHFPPVPLHFSRPGTTRCWQLHGHSAHGSIGINAAQCVSLRLICSASHLHCCRIVPRLDSKIMHGPEYSPRVPLFHPVLPAEVPCSCFIVACPASRAFHSLFMLLEAARLTTLNTFFGHFFSS